MRILVLDPSAGVTGYAVAVDGEIIEAGFKEFTKTELDGGRYLEAHRWLKNQIYTYKPDLVIMESFFFSSRFANGSAVNAEVRGVFKMTCVEAEVAYVISDPSAWKKRLTGRVYPTKAEKKLYGKEKAKKMVTYNALKALGVNFPEKVVNSKTGKTVNFKFDTSDAIGILVSYLMEKGVQFKFSANLFAQEPQP